MLSAMEATEPRSPRRSRFMTRPVSGALSMALASLLCDLRRSSRCWAGDRSGSTDLNHDLARDFGVCSDRECLVEVLKRQYVSDHVLDLRVLIEQDDGGVDLVVEAKGAPRLYLLRH